MSLTSSLISRGEVMLVLQADYFYLGDLLCKIKFMGQGCSSSNSQPMKNLKPNYSQITVHLCIKPTSFHSR